MKHMHTFKMLMVTVAIAIPLGLTASIPLVVAKPVKVPECEVLSPPYPTIQSAVNDATCSSIKVPKGTFNENVVIRYRDVTIHGHASGKTIVNGGHINSVFILDHSIVTLEGMTITDGTATDPVHPSGGGIGSAFSTLTVKDCVIERNDTPLGGDSGGSGGGIHSVYGTLTVEDSIIRNNTARIGGGIRAGSGGLYPNVVTIKHSLIADNVAAVRGGGILSDPAGSTRGTLTVNDSIVTGNAAPEGGGIFEIGRAHV